jgi:ribonuclease Z
MVDLLILGSGTPNPDVGRAGAAAAVIDDDGTWILIDAGRGATQRAIDGGLDLTSLRGVFITHHHSDHLSDLATLATTRWVGGGLDAMNVVAPHGPSARFAATCLDGYDDQSFYSQGGSLRPAVSVAAFEASTDVTEVWCGDGWSVSSVLVDHHPVAPAVGYRVIVGGLSIAVSGDTAVCDGMRALAADADVLVHEAVLTELASPSTLAWNAGAAAVGQMASSVGVRTLVLTHLLPAPRTPPHHDKYIAEARTGGWQGPLHIATDLLRLPIQRDER